MEEADDLVFQGWQDVKLAQLERDLLKTKLLFSFPKNKALEPGGGKGAFPGGPAAVPLPGVLPVGAGGARPTGIAGALQPGAPGARPGGGPELYIS